MDVERSRRVRGTQGSESPVEEPLGREISKHAVRGIPQDIFDWRLTCLPRFYGWAGYYDVLLVPEEAKEKKGEPNE